MAPSGPHASDGQWQAAFHDATNALNESPPIRWGDKCSSRLPPAKPRYRPSRPIIGHLSPAQGCQHPNQPRPPTTPHHPVFRKPRAPSPPASEHREQSESHQRTSEASNALQATTKRVLPPATTLSATPQASERSEQRDHHSERAQRATRPSQRASNASNAPQTPTEKGRPTRDGLLQYSSTTTTLLRHGSDEICSRSRRARRVE